MLCCARPHEAALGCARPRWAALGHGTSQIASMSWESREMPSRRSPTATSCLLKYPCIHAHACTHMHAHAHKHACTYIRTHTHAHSLTHACTRMHVHNHAHNHNAHTCVHHACMYKQAGRHGGPSCVCPSLALCRTVAHRAGQFPAAKPG